MGEENRERIVVLESRVMVLEKTLEQLIQELKDKKKTKKGDEE